MIFWKRYIIIANLIMTLTGIWPAYAQDNLSQPVLENIDSKLLDSQKKMHRLNKGVQEQKEKILETRDKEVKLLTDLDRLDQRLKSGREKLTEMKKKVTEHEAQLATKEAELVQVTQARKMAKKHIENRLAAFYRMGSIGVLNAVFSTTSLPDLLTFNEYFQSLIHYDQQVIAGYRVKINDILKVEDSLRQQTKVLLASIQQVEDQEKELAAAKKDRLDLLARVNTEKKLYQRALEEIEEASKDVTNTLATLKKQSASLEKSAEQKQDQPKKKKPEKKAGTFASQKGRLSPPVIGTVVTYFGRNTKGKFGITTFANGINIKAEPGTKIKAISDGKVAYSGNLRGYGNLMIIDHGDQYYSLTSRAEQFFKQEGDLVSEGDEIGVVSEAGGLLDEGLHFEIRHGTEPENPLEWLNNAKLTIKTTKPL